MVKILMGLAAAVVIAVGGFFGFEFYTQHRIAGEVEAAFAQIRAGGGKASHGKVSFDLKSRTLRIADIAAESATQPPVRVKIASLTASGVGQPDAGRFSADSIEASDIEISASIAGPAGGSLTYKMPRVVMKDYSGPASLQRPSASASIIDVYRSAFEQFAAVSATSVSAPSITGTINFGAAMSGDFAYSGTALQDIKGGKIATMQVERANFTVNTQQAGKADKMTGEIANLASRDFDASAAAAILDPQKANDDRYYRFYGKTTAGPYTVTSAQGLRMRIDEMTIDDVGVRPSRLQLPALLAMIQAAGAAPPTPAQARELIDKSGHALRGHADRNGRDARPLGRNTARPVQARRRSGSTWKTARSASSRSKGLIHARRKGPSRSDASRSNRSISPTSCACRRSSRTRRNRPRPNRSRGCFR